MSVPVEAVYPVQSPVNELVLVDDDKLTLEIVSWVMSKCHWQSQLFVDASKALEYLNSSVPRLLIVDFNMPGMTGLEFVQSLQESTDLSQTKIFLCSAAPPPGSTGEQFSRLGVDILEKQVICDRGALTQLLETYLHQAN